MTRQMCRTEALNTSKYHCVCVLEEAYNHDTGGVSPNILRFLNHFKEKQRNGFFVCFVFYYMQGNPSTEMIGQNTKKYKHRKDFKTFKGHKI